MGKKGNTEFWLINGKNSVLCRCEDKIKMDAEEVELEGGRWIHVAEDRDSWRAVANTVMDCWVLYSTGIFLCVCLRNC